MLWLQIKLNKLGVGLGKPFDLFCLLNRLNRLGQVRLFIKWDGFRFQDLTCLINRSGSGLDSLTRSELT